MSARIDAVNYALQYLGEQPITSLDDDSDRALTMKSFYYIARDATLEDANWTFATRRFQPVRNAVDPVWGWTASYTIPADIVRVTTVLRDWGSNSVSGYAYYDFPEEMKSAHVIEGNEILSNDDPIYCLGIREMDDEGHYSPLFLEAFAAKLAYLAALPITASMQKQQ
ncbi:unnamed protein product, partial [marine sediment metagenome]